MQPTKGTIPASAQGLVGPEGSRVVADKRAQGDDAAGEVVDHGTYEEDGPVTWETLTFPRDTAVKGFPHPKNPESPSALKVRTEARKEKDTFHEVGQRQGEPEPRPKGVRESEGRIRAETVGNGVAAGPTRAKAARVGTNLTEEKCHGTEISTRHVTGIGKGSRSSEAEPGAVTLPGAPHRCGRAEESIQPDSQGGCGGSGWTNKGRIWEGPGGKPTGPTPTAEDDAISPSANPESLHRQGRGQEEADWGFVSRGQNRTERLERGAAGDL